jgi:phosphatidate cytidylyltransferase
MLRTRILTAAILIPLVAAAVWYLPVTGFALVWGAIILLGAWEWASFFDPATPASRAVFVVLVAATLYGVWFLATHADGVLIDQWLVWPVAAWWLVLGVLLRSYPEKLLRLNPSAAVRALAGMFVLTTSWVLLCSLRVNFGAIAVLYLLALIWLADSVAYFVGRRWGKDKLSPLISPGKTFEGLNGALAGGALLAAGFGLAYGPFFEEGKGIDFMTVGDFVFLSLITVVFSVCGDLFESLLKRWQGVKDSGGMVPGHGGVLDRIDSLLAAAPIFYAGLLARILLL